MLRKILPILAICASFMFHSAANAQRVIESRGELLYSTACESCHTSQVHWRDRKLATNWEALKAEVRRWKEYTHSEWNEDDVEAVAHYLDATYYRLPSTPGRSAEIFPVANNGSSTSPTSARTPVNAAPSNATYLSGGIGMEEREVMLAAANEYNVRIVFALKDSGEYLADVRVAITDQRHTKHLELDSAGPWLFVNLPSGRYQLSAERNGTKINKTFAITKYASADHHAVELHLYWP